MKDSSQAWLAMIGPGIKGLGEIKQPGQLYQRQLAATVAGLLHEDYEANHPIADAFTIPVKDDGPAQPDLSSLNLNGIYLPISPINLLFLVSIVHKKNLRKKVSFLKYFFFTIVEQ